MRELIFIIVFVSACCAYGADVLWDALKLTKYDFGDGNVDYDLGWFGSGSAISGISGNCDLQVRMTLLAFDDVDYYWVSSYDDDPTVTGVTANWLHASKGDVANAGTTRNQKIYFNHCHLDHETGWDNKSFFWEPEADLYLMFAVGSTKEYNDNIPNPNCLYGWALLEIDNNGELELKRSAIGLDGQEMIVGAIPEPSSALLVLFGCAGLALKRRRLLFQCHRGHKHSVGKDGQ